MILSHKIAQYTVHIVNFCVITRCTILTYGNSASIPIGKAIEIDVSNELSVKLIKHETVPEHHDQTYSMYVRIMYYLCNNVRVQTTVHCMILASGSR